jgi:hypothetical protein
MSPFLKLRVRLPSEAISRLDGNSRLLITSFECPKRQAFFFGTCTCTQAQVSNLGSYQEHFFARPKCSSRSDLVQNFKKAVLTL